MAEKTADDPTEIAQVAPDEFVHQVGFGSIDRAADFEIDRGVAGRILQGLKIFANRSEELAAYLVIQARAANRGVSFPRKLIVPVAVRRMLGERRSNSSIVTMPGLM